MINFFIILTLFFFILTFIVNTKEGKIKKYFSFFFKNIFKSINYFGEKYEGHIYSRNKWLYTTFDKPIFLILIFILASVFMYLFLDYFFLEIGLLLKNKNIDDEIITMFSYILFIFILAIIISKTSSRLEFFLKKKKIDYEFDKNQYLHKKFHHLIKSTCKKTGYTIRDLRIKRPMNNLGFWVVETITLDADYQNIYERVYTILDSELGHLINNYNELGENIKCD